VVVIIVFVMIVVIAVSIMIRVVLLVRNFFPSAVGVVFGHRSGDLRCFLAEIFLVNDAALVDNVAPVKLWLRLESASIRRMDGIKLRASATNI